MEKWKHIIYPFFVEVYAIAATPFAQTWRWKWGNTFFGSRFLLIVFLAHPRKNTSTWQNFVRLRIPNLVRISISLAIASPSSCSSDQNWSYHEKSVWWWIWEFLGSWGDPFFVIYWPITFISIDKFFLPGFRSVLGRSRSPVFGHESSMGASLGGSFCWCSYHFLWSSYWQAAGKSNSRVNPFTKVAGLHWKYGRRGKFQQKWFLVYWLLQAALDLRKNMEAKKSTPKWRVAHPFFTHLHCLGFQNVNFPCFGSARFAAFIRLFNSNFTARALHTRQQGKPQGKWWENPWDGGPLHNQPHIHLRI